MLDTHTDTLHTSDKVLLTKYWLVLVDTTHQPHALLLKMHATYVPSFK